MAASTGARLQRKGRAHRYLGGATPLHSVGAMARNLPPSPFAAGWAHTLHRARITVGEWLLRELHGKLRDELLNGEIFYTLKEAQGWNGRWRQHYNTVRPRSSLGYIPPVPAAILPHPGDLLYAPPRSANLGNHNRRSSNLSGGPP
jgi:hypothetical protein